jgi:hypothetical protein
MQGKGLGNAGEITQWSPQFDMPAFQGRNNGNTGSGLGMGPCTRHLCLGCPMILDMQAIHTLLLCNLEELAGSNSSQRGHEGLCIPIWKGQFLISGGDLMLP